MDVNAIDIFGIRLQRIKRCHAEAIAEQNKMLGLEVFIFVVFFEQRFDMFVFYSAIDEIEIIVHLVSCIAVQVDFFDIRVERMAIIDHPSGKNSFGAELFQDG